MEGISVLPLARHARFQTLSGSEANALACCFDHLSQPDHDALARLLTDPEQAMDLLDRGEFRAAVHRRNPPVHDFLSRYVDIRHALLARGINDRSLCCYLANVWQEFQLRGILPALGDDADGMLPTVDVLRQLNFLSGEAAFELLARSGNYYLFLLALFEPFFIRRQTRHGAPGPNYYEAFARCAFRAAKDHALANELELVGVYRNLSDHLGVIRSSLCAIHDGC